MLFQSTHPLRGATRPKMPIAPPISNFNPRTPCGVRPQEPVNGYIGKAFQSTHPSRGATTRLDAVAGRAIISIHAPLAGCDPGDAGDLYALWGISIHAPLAGCDGSSPSRSLTVHPFQSTHHSRGARFSPAEFQHIAGAGHTQCPGKMRISRVTRRSPRLSVNPPLWAFS